MFKSIGNVFNKAWKFFEGKKRRIAVLSGFVMTIAKPHTLAYQIAEGCVYLFGGADAAASSTKIIKDKLPSGKR